MTKSFPACDRRQGEKRDGSCRKKLLDISSLIKYNFLMHYKNVTKK